MTKGLRWPWLLLIAVVFSMGNAFAQFSNPSSGGSYKSEADLRRQAEKYFKHEDYATALPLYSQLLSLNQKDALLNYRYGVCLLMADKDKTSAYNYLEFASRDEKTDEDVLFYIAKTLQLKYRFDDAISTYKDFIKWVGKTTAEKFDVEHQIETCKNAKELMKTRVNLTVIHSKEVSKNAIYGAYDITNAAGKFLATPEQFLSSMDKRKIPVPIMFLTADGQTIYYSSYGKKEGSGKDIYVIHKLASGQWGLPENLGTVVNTKYDEDYPYLDADGKTLYFSSKGHNSMGGYDIFKTTFNTATGDWTEPENLGAGINSPDDDFFYMPVSDGTAQFASTKETAKGTVTIYTIETAASKRMLATVHGRYKSLDQARADGKISVLRKSDNGLVATSRTDARTGEYELSIPSGDDYEIVVEGGGYMPHVEDFSVPAIDRTVTIAQQINMDRKKGAEELEIRNQFIDAQVVDASPPAKNAELLNGQIAKSDSQQSNNLTMQQFNNANKIQVIKQEYKVDEMNKQKLQPFTIDGQVVYATPPTGKNVELSNDQIVKNDSEQSNNLSIKQFNNDLSQPNNLSGTSTQNTELKTQSSESPTSNSQSSAKANNVSDKDLVKTAFSDAKEIDEEAKQMTADAAVANATAIEKDSVSKAQLTEINKALKAGDEETARELERQSQLNADTAKQSRTLANQLNDDAKTKHAEALRAYADAKELMKNTRVDTSARVAMNKSGHRRNKGNDGNEISNGNVDTVNSATQSDDVIKVNKANEVNEYSTNTATQSNEVAKVSGVNQVTTDSINSSSISQTPGGQAVNNEVTKDSLNSSITSEAQAPSIPQTSEEATEQVKELQKQSKDFKVQSDALKEQAKKSDDKEEKMTLTQEAKDYYIKSEEKSKEAKKESAVAKELKKKEEKNPPQANEVANASNKNTPTVDQATPENSSVTEKETKNETPSAENNSISNSIGQVSKENNVVEGQTSDSASGATSSVSGTTSAISTNDQPSIVNNPASAEKTSKITPAAQSSERINPVDSKASGVPSSQQGQVNQAETSAIAVPDDPKSAEVIKTVSPEAVQSYKEYISTKNESDAQAQQAEDIQAKIEKMPPSPQRDQLIQQANDLNIASIKSWQAAQVKLNEVKEIDPTAEPKLREAFPQAIVKTNAIATISQVNSVPQPKDSLMTQAVTHREIAENANDTATEKSELKKTEQLIVESSNAKKNESVSELSAKNQVDSQTGNSSADIKVNEASENANGNNPAPLTENKSIATATKESSVIQGNASENNKASQNEVVRKSGVKEIISEENATETGSTVNASSAVLEANELHVDEAAVFSYSPQPVYNATNPVPMNPSLPEGLVFKVQIGAFHNPLSPDAFKNVQPLSGETTRPGWIRYCVGLFRTFEPANLVKTEMRSSGYKDAFVVAYYNGQRISLFDAYSIINRSGSNEKELYAVATEQETHHLNSMNIKSGSALVSSDEDAASFYGTSATKASADESAVEYAVQVGVYKTNVVPKKLQPLIPLNAEPYKNSLYRFTTGRFSTHDMADSARKVAVNKGVKDAFIIIYKGGKRAGEIYTSIANSKTNNAVAASSSNASTSAIVNEIVYKVQIGAYRTDLSEPKLSALKTQCNADVSQSISASGLHLIYAGAFAEYNPALLLKNDLASKGIKDAFVVAFSGNTKISIDKTRK